MWLPDRIHSRNKPGFRLTASRAPGDWSRDRTGRIAPRRCRPGGDQLRLAVSYVEGRKHLPIVELRRAA